MLVRKSRFLGVEAELEACRGALDSVRERAKEAERELDRARDHIRELQIQLRSERESAKTNEEFAREEIRHLLDLLAVKQPSVENMQAWAAQLEATADSEEPPADGALPASGLLGRLNEIWNDGWKPEGGWQHPSTHPIETPASEEAAADEAEEAQETA